MNNKGMTLVELVVSMCVSLMIVAGVFQLGIMCSIAYANQRIQTEQMLILETIEFAITDELRYAQDVELSNTYAGTIANNGLFSNSGDLYYLNTSSSTSSTSSTVLAGRTNGLLHDVEVIFNKIDDDIISAYIRVYNDDGKQVSKTIYCKIMNFFSGSGKKIDIKLTASGAEESGPYYLASYY